MTLGNNDAYDCVRNGDSIFPSVLGLEFTIECAFSFSGRDATYRVYDGDCAWVELESAVLEKQIERATQIYTPSPPTDVIRNAILALDDDVEGGSAGTSCTCA